MPPVLTAPPVIHTTHCTEAAGLDFGVVADDDCGIVSLTSNTPAQMPLGTTLVTWEASDAAGNVVTVSQEIRTEPTDDPSCCPAGYNVIMGTTNDDQLTCTSGSDRIIALGGQDKLSGLGGNDALSGGDFAGARGVRSSLSGAFGLVVGRRHRTTSMNRLRTCTGAPAVSGRSPLPKMS